MDEFLEYGKNCQRADDVAFLFRPKFCIRKPALGPEEKLEKLASLRESGKIHSRFYLTLLDVDC